jgi:hypothetical protein
MDANDGPPPPARARPVVALEGFIEMMRFVTFTWVMCRSGGKSHSLVNRSCRHAPSGTMGGGQLDFA